MCWLRGREEGVRDGLSLRFVAVKWWIGIRSPAGFNIPAFTVISRVLNISVVDGVVIVDVKLVSTK